MPVNVKQIIANLKLLPTIAFALMLGAGMVVTGFAAWFTILLGYGKWPESVAEARITSLGTGLCISLALIGLIIVALAFGKISKLAVTAPNGIGANLEFEDDEEQK